VRLSRGETEVSLNHRQAESESQRCLELN